MLTIPTRPRRVAASALTVAALLVTTACSGDDEPEPQPAEPSSGAAAPLATTATVAEVTGRLDKQARAQVLAAVTAAVDTWWDEGYLAVGDGGADPFAAFSSGAARLAQRDADVLTNEEYAERIDGAVATRRWVAADILAVKGRAAGVRARVGLVFETTGELEQRVTVKGTVDLAPAGDGWEVFSYDASADARPLAREGQ